MKWGVYSSAFLDVHSNTFIHMVHEFSHSLANSICMHSVTGAVKLLPLSLEWNIRAYHTYLTCDISSDSLPSVTANGMEYS